MKLLIGLVMASLAFGAGWEAVQRLAPEEKVEVGVGTETVKGTFVSASDGAVVVRTKGGERSFAKGEVRDGAGIGSGAAGAEWFAGDGDWVGGGIGARVCDLPAMRERKQRR